MKFAYSEAQARSNNSAVVSYFFNARGEGLEKSTCGIRFCLAIEKLDNRPLICFVDALDECEDSEDQAQQGHTEDITKYIQSNLKAGKSERVDKLKTEVQEKSQGVFLWVVLVVPMLQKAWDRGKVKSLRECLQSIPDDLNKLFKDILCRDTEDMQELVLCLKWLLYAGRPLKPEELYFGILSGTNPESLTPWEPGDDTPEIINRFILSSSKGLAEPTRNKVPTVQFIHESVRDFLLEENGLALIQDNIDCTSAGPAHDQLKHCCQNYIDSVAIGQSKDSSSEATTRFPFLEYSIRHIFKHAELAASHMISQEVFLADFALGAWIILHDIVEKHKIRRYGPQTSLLYVLVEQSTLHLCRTEICINQKSINTESVVRYAFPVIAAAAVGNQQILELLLQNGADINSKCKEYGNALHVAIEKGNTSVVNTLVELGLTAQFRSKSRWADLLAQAVRKSRIQIVRLLLSSHPEWLDFLLRQSDLVRDVFKSGHETIVRLLLDHGADVNAPSGFHDDTALYAASENGHETIVRMLLDHGADVNNLRALSRKPLHAALRWGYVEVVSLLLEYGADMDACSVYYSNALMAAEACGNEQKRAVCKQILIDEKRKRQPEPYLVWVDGIAYLNYQ
ncbi:purine and uridine phosphorylase [Aureobasidium pullulans]|uniref:Purine and uridine phosphorylase n=1 Tax=Aureobasidium pullulans TaxID=5580 RepID=A0A4S9X1Q7_AURPU|nr:purine and uridine phosphorylase [Aureobasidium pullulans]